MKLDIYGYEFTVEPVNKDDERIKGCDGLVLYNDFLILIRDDLNKTITACVLRHELTHAIMCIQGRCRHEQVSQEDMCEFIGFQAPYICEKTEEIIKVLKLWI